MKRFLFLISLLYIVGCTSQYAKNDSHSEGRSVASFDTECKIVKHPEKDLYNLSMYGKKYNQFWYTELEMELLYQRFVSQGRCD